MDAKAAVEIGGDSSVQAMDSNATKWREWRSGGVAVRLLQPADPDQLLDAPDVVARNRLDDFMPYWAYLWPASQGLAQVVAGRDWAVGTSTLEIGCGLGLPGLVALARGLSVDFTDYDPMPLWFAAQSATGNGFDPARWSTSILDWRSPPDRQYDLILGADLLYEAPLVPLVVGAISKMLSTRGEALITTPFRTAAEGFGRALTASGLRSRTSEIGGVDADGNPWRGELYSIERS